MGNEFKVGDKVKVKPHRDLASFYRKKYEVAEINNEFEYPVMITRNREYFYFKHDELELINEKGCGE